jgi:hypothetical protein
MWKDFENCNPAMTNDRSFPVQDAIVKEGSGCVIMIKRACRAPTPASVYSSVNWR